MGSPNVDSSIRPIFNILKVLYIGQANKSTLGETIRNWRFEIVWNLELRDSDFAQDEINT